MPETQQGVTNLAALAILTAIPVVAFALWCDYAERLFKANLEEGHSVDRKLELYRIKSSAFFVQAFQIILFFGTTPLRREHPLIAYPLFVGAVMIQFWTQKGLEAKIRQNREEGSVKSIFKAFFWSSTIAALYLFVLISSVVAFSAIGIALHASFVAKVTLLVLGMSFGVGAGLSLCFALAAFFARKITDAKPIVDGPSYEFIKDVFSGFPMPKLWLVEQPSFQFGNAMMAGFPSGRGIFAPGFFLSSTILKRFSDDEIRSILLHEVSHLRLKHIRKRCTLSFALILCSSLATGIAVLIGRALIADLQTQEMIGCLALAASFIVAFRVLARQVKFQELTADIHSIEKLGSKLEALCSALRKLDQLHDDLPRSRDVGARMLSLGHPVTEYRIRILERYFQNKAAQNPETPRKAA